MSTVAERTRVVSGQQLADYLGKDPSTISRAARHKYLVGEGDWAVFEWAEWHPGGNQVRHYKVPVSLLKRKAPPSELRERHGIFPDIDDTE